MSHPPNPRNGLQLRQTLGPWMQLYLELQRMIRRVAVRRSRMRTEYHRRSRTRQRSRR